MNSRTCVGCRTTATPDPGWRRCARDGHGRIGIGRQVPGRGAWLCSPECFEAAVRRGALARALRAEMTAEVVDGLRARLFDGPDGPKR